MSARDIEKAYPRRAFVATLRRLADTLARSKRFSIQVAGTRIVVPRQAAFGIEHEREGGVEEIEFQITWKTTRRRNRAGTSVQRPAAARRGPKTKSGKQ